MFRVENNICNPNWKEFLMDDEKAVQSILLEVYPDINISLCLFHLNKNVLKCIAKENMSNYFKKCSTNVELWVYHKIRNILALPFLPQEAIQTEFLKIKDKIRDTLKELLNPMEIEKIEKILEKLSSNYYSNQDKISLFCKFGKLIRTTNNMESYHSSFNKSLFFNKNSSMTTTINGNFFYFYLK